MNMAGSDGAVTSWHRLLRENASSQLCTSLAEQMRERRLTFCGRLLCPFLRPFFLTPSDEARVKDAAEMLWHLGERVAKAGAADARLLEHLGLNEEEIRLAQLEPGYDVASTAGRADAFILPGSLQFAEYNAESPAGPAYSQRLAPLFHGGPVMAGFRRSFDARFFTPMRGILEALLQTWGEWRGMRGGDAPRVAIVDWRDVPTWSEFELLRDA